MNIKKLKEITKSQTKEIEILRNEVQELKDTIKALESNTKFAIDVTYRQSTMANKTNNERFERLADCFSKIVNEPVFVDDNSKPLSEIVFK